MVIAIVKRMDIDQVSTRLMIAFFLYLLLMGLIAYSLDLALALLSLLSALLTLYFYHRDKIYIPRRKQLVSIIGSGLITGLLVYLKNPSINEFSTVFFRNAVSEELIFRFGMLGILRSYAQVKTRSPLKRSTWALIVLNASLFSLLHHYVYLSTFTLSILYAYSFLRLGIVSAIAFHVFWNFYHRFDIVLVVIGGIIAYESYYAWRTRSRTLFRWYKHSSE